MADSVKLTKAFEQAAQRSIQDGDYTYEGLRIHALPGLHEKVGELIGAHAKSAQTALDLGAGSGAMTARLKNLGLEVTAVDWVKENFSLHDKATFVKADLNGEFSLAIEKKFDVVVAVEIIEHLENPRNFLRQVRALTKKGSKIFLSTPNIDNPVSKALFCRFGYFLWFSDDDYESVGHIVPIARWLIEKICDELNLRIEHYTTCGDPYRFVESWPKMKMFSKLIEFASGRDKSSNGEISIYVIEVI